MKKSLYPVIGTAILLTSFFIGRCSAPDSILPHPEHAAENSNALQEPSLWTCSMHPQIQQSEPGDCPICGMDLIPLVKDAHLGPRTMSMSASSRALADIQTTLVEKRFPEAEIRLVGKLDYDETKVKSLTARFPARIDQLFVNYTGVHVATGDHLARVYSPELLTAQSELLTAHRYGPDSAAAKSAREKLRLWDLLPSQIDSIIASGEAKDYFELKAPIDGVVVHKNVNEGDYFKTGQALFTIVDLDDLWLKLDAYESDLMWLKFGQTVTFTVEAFPGENFEGKIAFIDPEFNRQTRTVAVRVNVPNADHKLKPGMFAKANARARIAASGNVYSPEYAGKWISPMHPEIVKEHPGQCDICGMDLVPAETLGLVQNANAQPPLVIPAASVLRTGKRAVVYIEIPNTEQPTFEGRVIELGPRAGDEFIVVSGLEEGDRIVTNGAFKIDSALQIQAKPSMMNPQSDSMPMSHEHAKEPAHANHESQALDIPPALLGKLLSSYLALQSALAADDLDAAKTHLKAMMEVTGHSGPLPMLIHTMLAAESLDTLRKPHFETLSNALIESVSKNPNAIDGELYQMHCPMVYPNRGADWLQSDDNLKNPYFGAMMLTCGEVKATLGSGSEAKEGKSK